MYNRRLLSIDFLRGLAIVVLVIIHRIHYHWGGMRSNESIKEYMSGPLLPLLIFFILLLSMAGVFYFMTGIVNSYTIYSRIKSGKNRWQQTMLFGILGGFWLLILNYIQRLFFMNGFLVEKDGGVPEYQIGYITGLIRDASQVRFYWQQVTEPGTLSLIGILLILVSIITSVILIFRNKLSLSQMQGIIVFLAFLSLVSSIFLKLYLVPEYDKSLADGQYFMATIYGHICKDFSISPYLGFALVGAAIGLSLASGENKKMYFRKSVFMAVGLSMVGVLIYLVFDKDEFGGRGTLGALVSLVELGIFIVVLLLLLKRYDYCAPEKQEKRRVKNTWIRRFGMMSLTVFIMEPVIAELLKKGIDLIIGNSWSDHLILVLLFAGFCLLVWHWILKFWQKAGFIGSFEWLTGWMLIILAGKKSGKVNFKEL